MDEKIDEKIEKITTYINTIDDVERVVMLALECLGIEETNSTISVLRLNRKIISALCLAVEELREVRA